MSYLNQIGAIWTKQSKNDNTYLSLNLHGLNLKAFVNTYKKPGSMEPDYKIFEECEGEKPVKE